METADALKKQGVILDFDLVEIGALLHDIGRSKTHSVNHGVVGAEIVESAGLPDPVVSIVKRHVGGGVTAIEAETLGWPKDGYVPVTLEEKVVSYADKLIEKGKRAPIEVTIEKFKRKGQHEAAERVRSLYCEIKGLLGDNP